MQAAKRLFKKLASAALWAAIYAALRAVFSGIIEFFGWGPILTGVVVSAGAVTAAAFASIPWYWVIFAGLVGLALGLSIASWVSLKIIREKRLWDKQRDPTRQRQEDSQRPFKRVTANKRSHAIAPELTEEVQTLYNAWLKPAGDAANDVIRRVLLALRDHADASVRSHEGLIQRSIIDVERAALSKLNNVLTGTEPISDFDQLQDCIVNYYREYQGTRTWIAKAGELAGFPFYNNPVFQAWLHLDEKFLDALRDFAGPPRYERLRSGVNSVGWGENVTSDLERLAGSNSPDTRDNGNGTR